VLAHQNGRVRIVDQIAWEMWQFGENLSGHIGVALCCDEDGQARRGEERRDEFLC
jgi:hypothetical protein